MGQPDRGRPAPTESLLQPMSHQMPIQELRQAHLLHQSQEYHKIIDALCLNVYVFFHASQYARKFPFCLSPYANGEHLLYYITYSAICPVGSPSLRGNVVKSSCEIAQ